MTGPDRSDGERLPVLVRIRALLPELRPSERRIADEFISAPAAVAAMSIPALAQRCGTSTTSVTRFFNALGYQHVRQFRADVQHDLARETFEIEAVSEVSGDIDRSDTLADIVAKVSGSETLSISNTARALDVSALGRAVRAVSGARRVDVFGVGASTVAGADLQQKLTRVGSAALHWPDGHSAWTAAATLRASDVAIGISHSGATADTLHFLTVAGEHGATTIAVTNHGASPVARAADVVLTTAVHETRFRSGALGSRTAQLMVVDCLFIGVAQARYDESLEALRDTYEAVRRGVERTPAGPFRDAPH